MRTKYQLTKADRMRKNIAYLASLLPQLLTRSEHYNVHFWGGKEPGVSLIRVAHLSGSNDSQENTKEWESSLTVAPKAFQQELNMYIRHSNAHLPYVDYRLNLPVQRMSAGAWLVLDWLVKYQTATSAQLKYVLKIKRLVPYIYELRKHGIIIHTGETKLRRTRYTLISCPHYIKDYIPEKVDAIKQKGLRKRPKPHKRKRRKTTINVALTRQQTKGGR